MKFNKKIKNLFFEYVQLKKKLIETENEFEWSGNYLGDYGEYIAITKYNLEKSPKGTNGFDAINPLNGDKVQIKTVQKGTKSIHFNKNTDVLFVLVVSDDASWEVIYDGKLDKIFKKFGVRKKYTYNALPERQHQQRVSWDLADRGDPDDSLWRDVQGDGARLS